MKNPFPIRARQGPLTSELVQAPAGFGLGRVPENMRPAGVASSICGYCATGCQLSIHLNDQGQAINLTPQPEYPVNLGMACPKGWEALTVLQSPNRGVTPLQHDPITGKKIPISWEQAALLFCERMKGIHQAHGPEAVAMLSTGQIPFEEMAFLGSFFKFGMGFIHADANTRQCMATAATAYKQAFGFDAPPYSYDDFEESDVIVLVGSNLCIAHPILWQRIMRNQRQPQIIVIDPRRTETAMCATQHLPIKPKGDLALLQALAHCIIRDGRTDEAYIANHTEGFEEYKQAMSSLSPEALESLTGIEPTIIEQLAHTISDPSKRVSFWWTMGINQSHEGVRAAQAIIALALMTGNIGKPGTGANSITGQCNAMGSRLFSNTTNLLGGHDFTNPEHRQKISRRLGIPVAHITDQPSLAYDQIIAAAEEGKIKALWIVATNPFHSWIDSTRMQTLREKVEFIVVQDMYHHSETAQMADLFLPAAGWGEKDGCFINSERRIGTIKQVSVPPGQALSDFRIVRLLANAWGCGEWFREWTCPEAAFLILRDLTQGQPCDITGVHGYAMIDQAGGIPWPCPKDHSTGIKRLFADGKYFTTNQKARFLYSPSRAVEENIDETYPFFLLTGRGSSSQWHTLTRTESSAILRKLSPSSPILEMHAEDAQSLGFSDQQDVIVRSRRGEMKAVLSIAPTMRKGEVFLPMHYPEVNRLTHSSFDPHSRQPSYKLAAVSVIADH